MASALENTTQISDAEREWSYAERIAAIHARKIQHTLLKRQKEGARDNDDWGQIPLDEPFTFVPETDHPQGWIIGPKACGINFRRLCEQVPLYIDKMSSLLGGYYVTFNHYVTDWDPAISWDHLVLEHKKYNIIHGITSHQHFLPDVKIGLDLGFGGLLKKIADHRSTNSPETQSFYEGLENLVLGIQTWIARHVELARTMALEEANPTLRRNLEEMAEINARLIDDPPRSFRDACQWIGWYQMAKRAYIGGGSIGRLDHYFYPYYKADLESGHLTEEEAIFHLASLLVKDSSYIQLGGVDEQGRDQSNPLSILFLEAAHRMKIPANIAVMVHDDMDPALMRRAVELLFVDKMGIPRFCGLKGMTEGFARNGIPMEVARQRVQAGCHWYCLPGREYSFCDVIKINLAKIFDVALHEMVAQKERPWSTDCLWEIFTNHLRRAIAVTAEGIDFHMEHMHKFYPELAISLLCHGAIEKGVDASHGSLDYTLIGVDCSGLATVTDSFAALQLRIEQEQRFGWEEVIEALDANWVNAEVMRQFMQNVPGFGRGMTSGDEWAKKISDLYTALVKAEPTPSGWSMIPGIFSWASTINMGKVTPATPDGRKAGTPISFGANPNPGRFRGSALTPASMAIAIADVQSGYGNSAPFQFDVDPGMAADAEDFQKFEDLLRAHFELGGTLVNANVLDREKILDACHNPSKYPDLVVRVTGFSAYFASLSDDFRKLVYDRIVEMEEAS